MDFNDLMPIYKVQPEKSYQYRFTVFTPVYNCENSIEKVHLSLVNQTFKNFEWIIINDGSNDNSHKIITEIIKKSSLNITYINNNENNHKMSCYIQAIDIANGEFLLPFDGDDECYSNALESFSLEYDLIPKNMKPKVAAITVNCEDQFGNLVGELFPEDIFYCNTFEAHLSKQIIGEKWGFTKTDVLRSISINPKMLKIGYVPESIIWNTIARNGFLTKCINKTLRVYHLGVQNSIMNSPMTSKSAFGMVLEGISIQNWYFSNYFLKSPSFFLRRLYITLRTSTYLNFPLTTYLNSINPYAVKFLFIFIWPFRRFLK